MKSYSDKITGSIVNGKSVQSIGNIDIVYRNNRDDNTFSVGFINRMNNQSMTIHKFDKCKFAVEFGSPKGVDHVLAFKTIEIAVELALLNTDITRINEEIAVTARQHFVRCVSQFEPKAKNVKFTEKAWKLNKYRNKTVIFSKNDGEQCTGVLNVILPPSGNTCLITPDDDKSSRLTLSIDNLWIQ
ncbi:hypothetical protein [uncultured Tolumonas sp.]|uniref:hypothetical protein n=1 Tax=uncultured Tolumonas sp. TaxID=263765 RepID=UPI002A0A1A39|nr:hypothetical protein [uncultured Tolumonas sp.]